MSFSSLMLRASKACFAKADSIRFRMEDPETWENEQLVRDFARLAKFCEKRLVKKKPISENQMTLILSALYILTVIKEKNLVRDTMLATETFERLRRILNG